MFGWYDYSSLNICALLTWSRDCSSVWLSRQMIVSEGPIEDIWMGRLGLSDI